MIFKKPNFSANEYLFVAPNRYVFPGAEVFDREDDESDISSNNSGSDTDSDDEADSSDDDKKKQKDQQAADAADPKNLTEEQPTLVEKSN